MRFSPGADVPRVRVLYPKRWCRFLTVLPWILPLGTPLTVTGLNDFNGLAQTTNLGVRSSNLFGRAIRVQSSEPYPVA